MINSKGETIYTNAEIAYELGIAPGTVNAISKRLFGRTHVPHHTLHDAKLICEYVKSISVVEEARRLSALHEVVVSVFGEEGIGMDNDETRRRVDRDVHLTREN